MSVLNSYNKNKTAQEKDEDIINLIQKKGPNNVYFTEIRDELKHIEEDTLRKRCDVLVENNKITKSKGKQGRIQFSIADKLSSSINIHTIFGSRIYIPELIKDSFKIDHVEKVNILPNEYNLFIQLGSKYYRILLSTKYLPFDFHISRIQSNTKDKLKIIEESLYPPTNFESNSRIIICEIFNENVSSYKSKQDSGHALISFKSDGEIIIKDLNSKNKTFIKYFSEDHLNKELQDLIQKLNNTSLEETYQDLNNEICNCGEALVPHQPTKMNKTPLCVSLGKKFKIFIYK